MMRWIDLKGIVAQVVDRDVDPRKAPSVGSENEVQNLHMKTHNSALI